MSWQEAFTHIFNFLLLPLCVGSFVGAIAKRLWFKHSSYIILMIAGFTGCLSGLIAGWVITGRDGHMLGYLLLIVFCSLFISITAGKVPKKPAKKRK